MAANHTAMFEVLYQVRQFISLTHKICQGRNMPSHTKMHMFTPESAACTDAGQNTDTMTMIRVTMAWWWGALCLLIDHLQKNKHLSLKLKLALWPKLVIFYLNYNSILMPWSQVNVWWCQEILSPPSASPVVLSDWSSSGSGGASAGRGSSLTRFTSLCSSSASCGSTNNAKAQPWTPVSIPALFFEVVPLLTNFWRSSFPPTWTPLKKIWGTVLRPVSSFTLARSSGCLPISTSRTGTARRPRVALACTQWGQPWME